jgi:hypothetical protein
MDESLGPAVVNSGYRVCCDTDMVERTTAVSRSIRIAQDEAKWLSIAAAKGGVSQNELIRLALHRLRKDLGAANRVKPETVQATAKASKYKLTPQRSAS